MRYDLEGWSFPPRRIDERGLAVWAASLKMSSSLISVVDDDESVRESLPDFLRSFGLKVCAFASAEAFLGSNVVDSTSCLVLDVAMPGMSGPQLQQALGELKRDIPIIFISANSDANTERLVMGRGARAYLRKPFSDAEILGAITAALSSD